MRERDGLGAELLGDAREEHVARAPTGDFDRLFLGSSEGSDIHALNHARHAARLGERLHECRVGVGFGAAQPVVEVGDHESPTSANGKRGIGEAE